MSREERIQYLEDERVLLWKEVTELKTLIEKRTPEYEAEARLASQQAISFKDDSESATNLIIEKLNEITTYVEAIKSSYESVTTNELHTTKLASEVVTQSENVDRINSLIIDKATEIQTKIAEIEKIFESKPLIDEKLKNLESIFTKADDTDSKISAAAKSILDIKKEIDKTYYEIYGYVEFDEQTQKDIEYPGLIDKLEKSYDQISLKLNELDTQLTNLKNKTATDLTNFIDGSKIDYEAHRDNWNLEFWSLKKRIEELLPNAMTAGLSHAYFEKREIEEKESRLLRRYFIIGIVGLIFVSFIPFGVSIKLLIDQIKLEEVILKIPRIVLAILPLYIPVLWVAYSSNRKLNLSKRLIEEYSHKETLSKTFEGLSHQIKNIDDKDISNDLKIKLLYNILEVNSENPGKLISDYDKSDHPLMDALDKSIKLTNAVTKLANIPGFGKLASSIEKKSQKLIEDNKRKVEAGIEINEDV